MQHGHKNAVIPISCKTSPTSAPKSWSVSVGSCRCLKKLRMSCEQVATAFSGLFADSSFSLFVPFVVPFLKQHCLVWCGLSVKSGWFDLFFNVKIVSDGCSVSPVCVFYMSSLRLCFQVQFNLITDCVTVAQRAPVHEQVAVPFKRS